MEKFLKVMKKIFKVWLGIIAAGTVFVIVSKILPLIGIVTAGWIIELLNLELNPRFAENLESFGNIFLLVLSVYAAVKSYKLINGSPKQDLKEDDDLKEDSKWGR